MFKPNGYTSKGIEVEKQTVRTKGKKNPNNRTTAVSFRSNK